MKKTYPPGTVRRLLDTDLMTAPTRDALRARLETDDARAPRFFTAEEFTTLRAACARLVPGSVDAGRGDVALCIDERLAGNMSDGWRYNALPPDGEAFRRGLRGLDETARALFSGSFSELDGERQDEVLRLVQHGGAAGETWREMSPVRFFEELLVEVVESYYSHPVSQEEIGYVGMADARGWTKITLDALEAHEPRAVEERHD